VEIIEAHKSITTCAVIAPVRTKQLLSASEDPIFDICNPPPVTLVSKAESVVSSRAPTETESALATPASTETSFKRPTSTPAYVARSKHPAGHIIVTADYTGALKVFRQDCASAKRNNAHFDSNSTKRMSGIAMSRPSSMISLPSRTRRDSASTQPPHDRILNWQQDVRLSGRGLSPRKSIKSVRSFQSSIQPQLDSRRGTPRTSFSAEREGGKGSITASSSLKEPPLERNRSGSQVSRSTDGG
jgi:hypothetical protein